MNALLARLRGSWSGALVPLAALLISFGLASDVSAKGKAVQEEKPEKEYVLAYSLVILGVALGLVSVLRPSTRGDEAKRVEKHE